MSDTTIVYQYFSLDEWKAMAQAIYNNHLMSTKQKEEILVKFPSAAL